jgi:hypothetical protein
MPMALSNIGGLFRESRSTGLDERTSGASGGASLTGNEA